MQKKVFLSWLNAEATELLLTNYPGLVRIYVPYMERVTVEGDDLMQSLFSISFRDMHVELRELAVTPDLTLQRRDESDYCKSSEVISPNTLSLEGLVHTTQSLSPRRTSQ